MKKLGLLVTLLGMVLTTRATTFTFTPTDSGIAQETGTPEQNQYGDLNDLDHSKYYTWNIESTALKNALLVPGTSILSAKLEIFDLKNYRDSTADHLYVHLLNQNPSSSGVVSGTDTDNAPYPTGDKWYTTANSYLFTITGSPAYAGDITYNFLGTELGWLKSYAADGKLALGFDPDCHFYNTGVKLTITTGYTHVPEPADASAAVSLLGLAMFAVPFGRRAIKR